MKFYTIFIIYKCILLSAAFSDTEYLKNIKDISENIVVNHIYRDYVNLNRRIYYLFNSSNLIRVCSIH